MGQRKTIVYGIVTLVVVAVIGSLHFIPIQSASVPACQDDPVQRNYRIIKGQLNDFKAAKQRNAICVVTGDACVAIDVSSNACPVPNQQSTSLKLFVF